MIHSYKMKGYNIIIDQNSGCVHSVDEVAYDIINMFETEPKEKIKAFILDKYSKRDDVTPEDIDPEAPLFGDDGLGLDSIDALEIILLLDKDYGIKLKNPAEGKQVFYSVKTMADYIREHGKTA